MNGNDTDLFAFCTKSVDDFLDRLYDGTHRKDHSFRFRIAVICEWLVFSSGMFGDLRHIVSYDIRNLSEMFVLSLSGLEYDVIVLGAASGNGVAVRIEGVVLEFLDCIHVEQGLEIIIVHDFDFLDLVRSSESVKEMNERNRCLDRRKMSDTGEVHCFLDRIGAQHCATGLSSSVDIFMITEDGECAGS